VLTDRNFGDWAYDLWPALSDEVLREFGADRDASSQDARET
jgi:hypothetical protein